MSDKEEAERVAKIKQLQDVVNSFDEVHYTEVSRIVAREARIKFQAFKDAGFTEAQALELIKR